MILRPRISEKAYNLSQTSAVYVLEVPISANKITVKSAVQGQFGVEVSTVNTIVSKGKSKRTATKRNQIRGERSNIKKAYVTLKKGGVIPIFPAPEAASSSGGVK